MVLSISLDYKSCSGRPLLLEAHPLTHTHLYLQIVTNL